jgi:SAM-dependent methyltransferase
VNDPRRAAVNEPRGEDVNDPRRHAPATERNRQPIADVLRAVLPDEGTVLEVAAGTGEHAVFFARTFPGVRWQPSDRDPACRASIDAWAAAAGLDNLAVPALDLDARRVPWPAALARRYDVVVCINMVHIAPWEACVGLMASAATALAPGGALLLYGPFVVPGAPTAASNLAFDRSLKAMDPRFGLRDLGAVAGEAARSGLRLQRTVAMPANNLCVLFRDDG